jgi:PAS domain S-box-containing protein
MQQLATAIRDHVDALVDQYDARLQTMPGYSRLPETMRRELERHVLDLIAQCLEAADYSALVEYVGQRAGQWAAMGLDLAWFQQALTVLEDILVPMIDSAEASTFLWQALNRSQSAVWQMVAERAHKAEQTLRQSRQLLQTVMDNIPQAVFWKDQNLTYLGCNRAFAADAGLTSPGDVIGKTDWDMPWKEQAELYRADDGLVMESGTPKLDYEEPQTTPGGSTIWLRTSKVPMRDATGTVTAVLGMYEDITERKRLEREIQASLERRGRQVQTSIEVSQEIAAAPDLNELFRRVVTLIKERFNYYHAQIFRYDPHQDAVVLVSGYGAAGQKMLAAGHRLQMGRGVVGTAAASGKSILAADVTQDEDWRPNLHLPDTKGELAIPIKFRYHVLGILDVQSDQVGRLSEDDRLLLEGLCGQIAIAIESRRAEEAIKEEQRRSQAILEAVTVPMLIARLSDNTVVYANQAVSQIGNLASDKLIGSPVGSFARNLADQNKINEILQQQGYVSNFETQFQAGDGTLHWALLSARIINFQNEPCVLASYLDITDRKRAEAEREQLLAQQQKRALQLQTAAEVSRAASSILSLDELLPQAADLVRARFGLYYVGIFLVDASGQWAVLRAGTGEAGQQMLTAGHKLKVGGSSMISWCIVNRQARIALDVGEEAVRFDNPLLPLTRSELALPLTSRGSVIGAVTIQSDQRAAFTAEDITALQTMADQISNATENARLFEQAQAALKEVDAINRRLTGEAWESYLRHRSSEQVIWVSDNDESAPAPLLKADDTLSTGQIVIEPEGDKPRATVTAPIMLRGQTIGALRMQTPTAEWNEDVQTILTSIAGHIAQAAENTRLLEETEERFARERALAEATDKIRSSTEVGRVLETAATELARYLNVSHIAVRLNPQGE